MALGHCKMLAGWVHCWQYSCFMVAPNSVGLCTIIVTRSTWGCPYSSFHAEQKPLRYDKTEGTKVFPSRISVLCYKTMVNRRNVSCFSQFSLLLFTAKEKDVCAGSWIGTRLGDKLLRCSCPWHQWKKPTPGQQGNIDGQTFNFLILPLFIHFVCFSFFRSL